MKSFATIGLITTILLIILGASLVTTKTISAQEKDAIESFVASKGSNPVPFSWQHQVGKGI